MGRIIWGAIVCAFLTWLGSLFFDKWYVFLTLLVVYGWLGKKKNLGQAWWSGFIGVFAWWGTISLIKDLNNNHILSNRIAELMHLPAGSLMVIIAAVLGGLLGGLAMLSGRSLRKLVQDEKN